MLDRRDFIRLGGLAFLPCLTGTAFGRAFAAVGDDPATAGAAFGIGPHHRILILVELSGGNDGLNTVVPHEDERYRALRPRLALPSADLVPLGGGFALHGALRPLATAWEARELAVVQGLGYPAPNRSHFRSIEIWETGSDSDEFLGDGWLARTIRGAERPKERAADSIILGRDDPGPLDGEGLSNIVLGEPGEFARRARRLDPAPGPGGRSALDHILEVSDEIRRAAEVIEERRKNAPALGVTFPTTRFGQQCETAAQLLAAELPIAVVKLFHGGFDTHANQLPTHARLLGELAGGLAALRDALVKAKVWDRVHVATYSEFGRRAGENGSGGTDHGAAAPHFVLGGKVKGGLHGAAPDLGELADGDLRFTTDYRRLYATIREKWWECGGESPFGAHGVMEIV